MTGKPHDRRPRILLVDDHPLMRRGVRELLERVGGYEVVGEAADGAAAFALVEETHPDLVVCDVNLPDTDGIDLLARLIARQPDLRTIVLTLHHDDERLHRAFAVGVAAFASKDAPGQDLLDFVSRVLAGEEPIRAQLGRQASAQLSTAELRKRAAASDLGGSPLTPRELEILAAAARGLSNKEIARELRCSDQTVKNHLTNIMRKTETGDRVQAVLLGLRRGWIVIPPAEPEARA